MATREELRRNTEDFSYFHHSVHLLYQWNEHCTLLHRRVKNKEKPRWIKRGQQELEEVMEGAIFKKRIVTNVNRQVVLKGAVLWEVIFWSEEREQVSRIYGGFEDLCRSLWGNVCFRIHGKVNLTPKYRDLWQFQRYLRKPFIRCSSRN